MPNTNKFKSISISKDTWSELKNLSEIKFDVSVSIQTIINYLIKKNYEELYLKKELNS